MLHATVEERVQLAGNKNPESLAYLWVCEQIYGHTVWLAQLAVRIQFMRLMSHPENIEFSNYSHTRPHSREQYGHHEFVSYLPLLQILNLVYEESLWETKLKKWCSRCHFLNSEINCPEDF
jgi:hypothetical protein